MESTSPEKVPLSTKKASCRGCTLHGALGRVSGQRQPSAEVLFIGEAPGEQETLHGRPFVGAAGYEFEKLLARAGMQRGDYAIANVLQCRPPGNDMAKAGNAPSRCHDGLTEFIAQHPRVRTIVTLGGTAFQAAVPGRGAEGVSRYRGWWQRSVWGIPVMPTFHPSYLLPRRGQVSSTKWVGVVVQDLQRAIRGAPPGQPSPSYILDPSPAEAFGIARMLLEQHPTHLATDLETIIKQSSKGDPDTLPDGSGILRISFAWGKGQAMSYPWHSSYAPATRMLLGSSIPKATWNGWNFDYRVLRTTEMPLEGRLDDWMVAWHVLWPNLPKGLEFVSSFYCEHLQPWKHLSHTDFARYSAIDSDATWVTAQGIEKGLLSP